MLGDEARFRVAPTGRNVLDRDHVSSKVDSMRAAGAVVRQVQVAVRAGVVGMSGAAVSVSPRRVSGSGLAGSVTPRGTIVGNGARLQYWWVKCVRGRPSPAAVIPSAARDLLRLRSTAGQIPRYARPDSSGTRPDSSGTRPDSSGVWERLCHTRAVACHGESDNSSPRGTLRNWIRSPRGTAKAPRATGPRPAHSRDHLRHSCRQACRTWV